MNKRPYTFYMQLKQQELTDYADYASNGSGLPAPVALAVGDLLYSLSAGGITFLSSLPVIGYLSDKPLGEVALMASAFTGAAMMLRSVAGSPRFLWLLQLALGGDEEEGEGEDDDDEDSVATLSPSPPPPLPSTSEAETLYNSSMKLWNYVYQQVRAAEGDKLLTRPWARGHRSNYGLSQKEWSKALQILVDAGILPSRKAKVGDLAVTDYRQGQVAIREAIKRRGYILVNGNTWLPSSSRGNNGYS